MLGVSWIPASNGRIPPGAIQAGYDKDGGKLYVGRATFKSERLPAKIVPNQGTAFVAYGGKEHGISNYEVLCQQTPTWVGASNGVVPHGALPAGNTSSGETLYVGRVHHDGTVTPGKIHPSHRVCYIPYGGKEIAYKEYEALVMY